MHKSPMYGGNGANIVTEPKRDLIGREIRSLRFGFYESYCNRYEEVNGEPGKVLKPAWQQIDIRIYTGSQRLTTCFPK